MDAAGFEWLHRRYEAVLGEPDLPWLIGGGELGGQVGRGGVQLGGEHPCAGTDPTTGAVTTCAGPVLARWRTWFRRRVFGW